jgi:hypothetical protein
MNQDPMRALRDRPAPDLWHRIEPRLGEDPPRPRNPARGAFLSAAVALAVATAGLGGLWLAFGEGGETALPTPSDSVMPSGSASPPTIVPATDPPVAGVVAADYPLGCSARVEDATVAPGDTARILVTLTNDGDRALTYEPRDTTEFYVVRGVDGGVLFDKWASMPIHPGPAPVSLDLPPGQTATIPVELGIRWPGPLSVLVPCPHTGVELPALPAVGINVVPPGPAPNAEQALTDVLAATDGLFDQCEPGRNGEEVTGRILPPDGVTDLPPMEARCAALVEVFDGFVRITVQIVSPPDAPPIEIREGHEGLDDMGAPASVFRWTFVATDASVSPVVEPWSEGFAGSGVHGVEFAWTAGRWDRGDAWDGPVGYFGPTFEYVTEGG